MALAPQATDLPALIRNTARTFSSSARLKGLALELDLQAPARPVSVDPLRLRQVLSNLLSNAIKFTDHGGIRVVLLVENQPLAAGLTLSVEDSGAGISAADQVRLFSPYAQVGQQPARQGTGLGLVISRTLCELMGGALSLESQPGQGTRVTVDLELPWAATLPTPGTEAEQLLNEGPALNILVVDDYPANLMLLDKQLGVLGHSVTQASDGATALQSWRDGHFDVLITDCNMPGMDGHELTRQVRQAEISSGRSRCLILGLTANAQAEERERCLNSGMDDCLFKPIGLGALRQHLNLTESAQTPVAEDDSGFDLEELRHLTLNDPQLIRQLLEELARSTREDLAALRRLGPDSPRPALKALAHRIRGGMKMLKARGLVAHCDALEHGCAQGLASADVQVLKERLEASLERLLHVLKGRTAD